MSAAKSEPAPHRHSLSARLFRHRWIVATLAILSVLAAQWSIGGLWEQWQMQRLAEKIRLAGGDVTLKSSPPVRLMAHWRSQSAYNHTSLRLCGPTFTNRWLQRYDNLRLFQIESLTISDCPLYASEVSRLIAQHPVEYLGLYDVPGMDAIAASLSDHESLTSIAVSGSDLSDAGFQHLPLEQLDFLYIDGSLVTPAGLRALERCRKLGYLRLDGRQFDQSVSDVLRRQSTVTMLELTGEHVTDASLQNLAGLPLVYVSLHDTSATDEGVETLRMAMPKCRVYFWNNKKSSK